MFCAMFCGWDGLHREGSGTRHNRIEPWVWSLNELKMCWGKCEWLEIAVSLARCLGSLMLEQS